MDKMDSDLFLSTASYYARHRPPYPPSLIAHIRSTAAITGSGRLLDLGCGTGELALPLSEHFAEVWAVDQQTEMVEAGQEKAGQAGITNVSWTVGRAEELEAQPASFDLVCCPPRWLHVGPPRTMYVRRPAEKK